MRRNKPDARNRHPWKAEVVEGHTNVSAATINGWFESVYDPDFPAVSGATAPLGAKAAKATTTPAVPANEAEQKA